MKLTIKLDFNGINIRGDIGLIKQLNDNLYKYINSIINNGSLLYDSTVEIYDNTFKINCERFSIFNVYRNAEDFSNKINKYSSIISNITKHINIIKNSNIIEDIEFDLLNKGIRINNSSIQILIKDLTREDIIIKCFNSNFILICEDNKYNSNRIKICIDELYSSIHEDIYSNYLTIVSEQENTFEALILNVENLTYKRYRMIDNIYDAVIYGILGILFENDKILEEMANSYKLKLL